MSDPPIGPQGGAAKASSGEHDAADAKQLDREAARSVVERVLEVLVREAVRRMHNTEEASDGQEGAAGAKQLDGDAAKVEASGSVMERVLMTLVREAVRRIHSTEEASSGEEGEPGAKQLDGVAVKVETSGSVMERVLVALVREAVRRIHSTQGSQKGPEAAAPPKKHQMKRSRSFAGHPSLEDSDAAPLLRRAKSFPDLAALLQQHQDQASGVAHQDTARALSGAAAAGDGAGAGGADEQQQEVGDGSGDQDEDEEADRRPAAVKQEEADVFILGVSSNRLKLLRLPLRVGARKEYEVQSMMSAHRLTLQGTVLSWDEDVEDGKRLICQMQRAPPIPGRHEDGSIDPDAAALSFRDRLEAFRSAVGATGDKKAQTTADGMDGSGNSGSGASEDKKAGGDNDKGGSSASSGDEGKGETDASAAPGNESPSSSDPTPSPPPPPPQVYGPKTLFDALDCHPFGSLARQNFVYQYLKGDQHTHRQPAGT